MKKGAIFDQDGLMFDTEKLFTRSWLEAGRRMGVDVPMEFTTAISGTSIEGMYTVIPKYMPEIDVTAYIELTHEICYELQANELEEKKGLRTILEFFKANGVKMAVASSSQRPQIDKNLKKSGIGSYFDAVISGSEVEKGKPDPEIFLKAVALLGLDPEDCYVFEDSFNGVRAGHAAGCCTIMIPDLKQPDEEISALFDGCCMDLEEAVEWIKRH